MAKLLFSYLFICMFVFSVFLALPNADGGSVRTCSVILKLSKPCSFQECQPPCLQKYNGNGVCLGDHNNVCSCVYTC
ncbi:unnamed protein product [Cochlearia groenlandica]